MPYRIIISTVTKSGKLTIIFVNYSFKKIKSAIGNFYIIRLILSPEKRSAKANDLRK